MKSKGYSKGGARMMKARGGKMAKGYSKGGARMMKAMGGKMAKGYAVGGVLTGARAAIKGVTALRAAAKKLGYGVSKLKTSRPGIKMTKVPSPVKMTPKKKPGYGQGFLTGAAYTGAATVGAPALFNKKKKKKTSAFGTAFSKARKSGKKTFTYQGKKYTTKVKK
tara:strand:- start:162 stop:656 length:495 start_codon:yes stop_codon:yes gene_type:complete